MSSDDIINAPSASATSNDVDVESKSKYAPSTSTTPSISLPPPPPIIKSNDTNPNRLAPYNPTHSTAQSSALSLLRLTHNDTFFDLGCGDGRLIIAALEKCYNDDYLMTLHQEQQQLEEEVKKLLLHNQIHVNGVEQQKQQSSSTLSPIRLAKTTPQHRRKKSVGWTSDNNNNSNNINTPALPETVRPQLHHARSYSTDASCSVPHLMRTASQEDDDDDMSHDVLSDVHSAPSAQGQTRREEEEGGDTNIDQELIQSSPTPQTPITPKICNRVKSTLTETTTHTDTSNFPQLPSANTSHDELDELDDTTLTTPNTMNVNEQGIPKTISTPQPSPNNNDGHHPNHNPNTHTHHAPQISELPTGLSLCNEDMAQQILLSLPDDDIRQVVGIAQAQGGLLRQQSNNKEGGQTSYHPLSAGNGGGNGGILLNAGEATIINTTTIPQTQTITTTQTQLRVTTTTPTRKGLQCVGIEYNQALAESAQTQFKQSHLYPHVREKVCIRWGDVLDEWNRVATTAADAVDADDAVDAVDESKASALNNDCQGDDDKQQGIHEQEYEKGGLLCNEAANKLTLLNDATAVFVYLLPKGLKKVKPLLYEAARRRHEDQKKKQKQLEEQSWKDDPEEEVVAVQEKHPLHRHPLQQPQNVHCNKPSHISDITDTDFIQQRSASPRNLQSAGSGIQLLQHHHKGVSHISDITDVDFIMRNSSSRNHDKGVSRRHISDITDVDFITSSRTTSLGRIVDRANDYDGGGGGGGLDDYNVEQQAAGLDRIVPTTAATTTTTMPNDDDDDDGNNNMIPSFRVVSYMFSIPGWKPTTVDRSSKGSCPLYLYENIHEMEVAEGE